MKNFSTQEVELALEQSPKAVKAALNDAEDVALAIVEIATYFGVNKEHFSTLAQLNRNLLIGLIKQEEFLPALVEAGISAKDARDIATEIKQKIFDPLLSGQGLSSGVPAKEEIENKTEANTAPTAAPPKAEPVPPVVPPVRRAPAPQVPVPSYVAPPLQSPRYVRSESPVGETMIAPVVPRAGAPRPHITLGAVGASAPVPAPATPAPKEAAPVQAVPAPAAPAQLEAAPVTPAAPAATPAPVAEPAPAPAPAKPATPPASVSYTADPYREPI